MKRVSLFLPILLLLFNALCQTYDFSTDDNNINALFRIYIPENVDTIKGVIHVVYPYNSDSRDFKRGIGQALLNSLHSFSVTSDHPELNYAPVFFNGPKGLYIITLTNELNKVTTIRLMKE